MDPKSNDSVLISNRKEDIDTQREGGCVKMEAEIVVMKLQAKECQDLPAAIRSKGRGME